MVAKEKIVKSTINSKYSKMDHHEHILKLPDTVVGSIEEEEQDMHIYDSENNKMIYKKINIVPGLYKIFDEILVNARDQTIRDKTCKIIKVNIDKKTGEISCMNDGQNGIPIEYDLKEKMYNPELIFGVLLTGENFDKKGKTVGGKNGYGAKLANIFSKKFIIDIVDNKNKVSYHQKFYDNMYKKDNPVITPLEGKAKSFVKITFLPDYKRFGLNGLTEDMLTLFEKRVYDISACTNSKIKVYLNDKYIKINNFKDYVSMYCNLHENENDSEEEVDVLTNSVYEEVNDRWQVCAVFDPNAKINHVSYVNGICTFKGGSHVTHISKQLTKKIKEYIIEKKGSKIPIKAQYIKENILLFVNSVIVDPSFSSQTKEELKTPVSKFGSKCVLSDSFVKNLTTKKFIDSVLNIASVKGLGELRKTDAVGKKNQTKDIEKLKDAHQAGKRRRGECRLILTEGDSAKTFAISGLEVIGGELFGVFPLKGKLLNVRDGTIKQLMNNEEIKNIKKILGLRQDKEYDDTSELRYGGGVIILTDQDTDGAHIKGLLINFIHNFWPSLAKIEGFIQTMSTPIVKSWKVSDKKKKNKLIFYTLTEYDNWKKTIDPKKWKSKYYKGLGTSTAQEAKECFNDFEKNIISYVWDIPKKEVNNSLEEEFDVIPKNISNDAITLAFDKSRADDRKDWLIKYNKEEIIDVKSKKISYYNFIHNDLKHFSYYDIIRSIPLLYDGFKPSLRKILFGSIKINIYNRELKVSQVAGYISAETAYHHGEMSLYSTIIGMAQNFPGSNNINLLLPTGGFGNRLEGGKNHASPRYIYTQLSEEQPLIFRKEDECVYEHEYDDGDKVEPVSYAPIIPTILVNGASGIATGFSTKIPSYNPLDIYNNLIRLLNGESFLEMHPWYRGFYGDIIKLNIDTYQSKGKYKILGYNKLVITELPIGTWTTKYVDYLKKKFIPYDPKKPEPTEIMQEIQDDSGDSFVNITITFIGDNLKKLRQDNKIYQTLKLTSTIRLSNMHLRVFNKEGECVIKKYKEVEEIFNDFIDYRLEMYKKRKSYYLLVLKHKLDILKYKMKFIKDCNSGKIKLREGKNPVPKQTIIDRLVELKYPRLSTNHYDEDEKKTYNYITSLSIFSLTKEELEILEARYNKEKEEYDLYVKLPIKDIWINELNEFIKKYKTSIKEYDDRYNNDILEKKKATNKLSKRKKRVVKKKPIAKK